MAPQREIEARHWRWIYGAVILWTSFLGVLLYLMSRIFDYSLP